MGFENAVTLNSANDADVIENRSPTDNLTPTKSGMTLHSQVVSGQSNSTPFGTVKISTKTLQSLHLMETETKIKTCDSNVNGGNSSLQHMCHDDDDDDDKIKHDPAIEPSTPLIPNDLHIQSETSTSFALGSGFSKVRFQRQHSSAETECTNNLNLRNLDSEWKYTGTTSETKNSLNSHTSTVSHNSKHSTQESYMGKTTKSMGIWSR